METLTKNKKKNSINTLSPYRVGPDLWCYDDVDLGVYNEAFVVGSSELINHLVGEECNNFTMFISKDPIPEYDAHIVKIKGDGQEGWYRHEESGMEHWLCGQCCQYFEEGYPADIYIKIKK